MPEVIFTLKLDPASGTEKPFPDVPMPAMRVNDFVTYKSPDGAIQLEFRALKPGSTGPVSPFADGVTIITGPAVTGSKPLQLKLAGRFFCSCTIIKPDGTRAAWAPDDPDPTHGGDHDVQPPQP
jgi:hypothetical protein